MAGVYTVKEINSYIRNMFRQDFLLSFISVKGEISNCKYHTSGHIYFTLKDADATLSVIMFASQAGKLRFKLSDGMSVVVTGHVDVYDAAGKYQLYVNDIKQEGVGELYRKFEELKRYYEDMGYFSGEYKRDIPMLTRKLGVVTSKTGAAVRDIINISQRRNPYVQIVLYPALVQGENAKYSITAGIQALDELGLDCIIVGRGGGSAEDLWAFNEPEVVEAIFNAKTPIISAVGHETDFTLADFVADLRAPTPSAAAELAVCEMAAFENTVAEYARRLRQQVMFRLSEERDRMSRYKLKLDYLNPVNQVFEKRQRLIGIEDKLTARMNMCLTAARNRLSVDASRLEGLSPLKKLETGYGYVESEDDKHIISAKQVKVGSGIKVYLKDGTISAKVTGVDESWQRH